jgi:hypothetical protein
MGNIGNILTKVTGGVGLGLILIDSHNAGKISASQTEKNHKATSISERYLDDMKLDSPSVVKQHVKKGLFNYFVDENLTGFFTSIGGYVNGFSKMMVGNVIPLALSAGTFAGKGLFSKACGIGLLAYGGIFLAQEIFGIGKSK